MFVGYIEPSQKCHSVVYLIQVPENLPVLGGQQPQLRSSHDHVMPRASLSFPPVNTSKISSYSCRHHFLPPPLPRSTKLLARSIGRPTRIF